MDAQMQRADTLKTVLQSIGEIPESGNQNRRMAVLNRFSPDAIDHAVAETAQSGRLRTYILPEIIFLPFARVPIGTEDPYIERAFVEKFCRGLGVSFQGKPVDVLDQLRDVAINHKSATEINEIPLWPGYEVTDALANWTDEGPCRILDTDGNLEMLVLPTKNENIFACFSGGALTQEAIKGQVNPHAGLSLGVLF